MSLNSVFSSDLLFNELYPPAIQSLAKMHWTPLSIARNAAKFLVVEKGVNVLDIGSGVGKFCLSAAHHRPEAFYYGVEQRKDLTQYAELAKQRLGFKNVTFIHANFTQLNLASYDHFYFYNSFYENLAFTDKIDDLIDYSSELYHYYRRYFLSELAKCSAGTRLATLSVHDDEMPIGFHQVGAALNDFLKFWIKI
jgi:SAM-dependent methyltransferase